jgi:hypothetical protein
VRPPKRFGLGKKRVRLAGAGRVKLSLVIPRAARRAMKRVFARRKRVAAVVVVRAAYASGAASARRKIALKR